MSAIDILRCESYKDYISFEDWCVVHNTSLRKNFYYTCIPESYWELLKKLNSTNRYNGKKAYVPIANFTSKQDKYLYWHCPFDFVREYLEKQCGYKKANWFVRLFWKY